LEPEEDTVGNGEMGMFFLEFLVDRASFVVSRIVATAENTSDIIPGVRSARVVCGVITCAFDALWFEMAVVFCVSVSLAVLSLKNISIVLGRFKFDFALLEIFNRECPCCSGQVSVPLKTWKKRTWCDLFDIPDVGYRVSQIYNFSFDIGRIYGVVHVLKHYSVGAIFRFVCVELCTFLGHGFDNCPIRVRCRWFNFDLVG
jgi:hypothetical protein